MCVHMGVLCVIHVDYRSCGRRKQTGTGPPQEGSSGKKSGAAQEAGGSSHYALLDGAGGGHRPYWGIPQGQRLRHWTRMRSEFSRLGTKELC